MKIISKFERYFFAQKESNFKRKFSRKKALKTLIISKREAISIDFFLLSIRKRESSLDGMYFEKVYCRGSFLYLFSPFQVPSWYFINNYPIRGKRKCTNVVLHIFHLNCLRNITPVLTLRGIP